MSENVLFETMGIQAIPVNDRFAAIFSENTRNIFDYEDVTPTAVKKSYRGMVPWGDNNELPYEMISKIGNDEVMSSNMWFNIRTAYGRGFRVTKNGGPVDSDDVKRFFRRNNMIKYWAEQFTDMQYFFFSVLVIILDKEGEAVVKIKGNILSLEKTTIAEYISQEFLQELLGQTKNNSFSEENRLIINNLRDAVCKLSIAQGVDNMSVIISTSGIVQARVASQFNYAREERLRGIKDGFEKLGYKLLNRVVDFMADNIEMFPTYAASKEYAARIAPGYENSEDSPIFSSLF